MIVITGATGFVGSQLVPLLAARNEVLLVSRDPGSAARCYPGLRTCDYGQLARENLAGAIFIHLAVRNNDRPGPPAEFDAVNVDQLLAVAATAKAGGAARFVNLCSTHALKAKTGDFYGLSKREGADRLAAFWPAGAVNLYVPAIYGDRFQGRLVALGKLPGVLRQIALALLRQVKPLLAVDRLAVGIEHIIAKPVDPSDSWHTEHYLADPVSTYGLYPAVKRGIDLIAVVAVAVVLGWAMVLIAMYVRYDSKGPAIFAQKRVGRGGRVFTCYKFRTMSVGTAHAATHDVSASAVTRAGRFLRRTKLDELPQIANVLMNQMGLVGPRPCLPIQIELVERRLGRGVLQMKPGITGLAQVHEIDMSDPARLAAWDDRYRAFRTLAGDMVIMLRTVMGGGSGDRVVPQQRREP